MVLLPCLLNLLQKITREEAIQHLLILLDLTIRGELSSTPRDFLMVLSHVANDNAVMQETVGALFPLGLAQLFSPLIR